MRSTINRISPVLSVSNIKEAIDWYGKALGFLPTFINDQDEDEIGTSWTYALLKNGEAEIHLCKLQPNDETLSSPSNCYLYVDDIQTLYAHLSSIDANVTELMKMPWGNMECWLHDPYGNRLVLSSPM